MDAHDAPTTDQDPVDEALGLMRRIADVVAGDDTPVDRHPDVETASRRG